MKLSLITCTKTKLSNTVSDVGRKRIQSVRVKDPQLFEGCVLKSNGVHRKRPQILSSSDKPGRCQMTTKAWWWEKNYRDNTVYSQHNLQLRLPKEDKLVDVPSSPEDIAWRPPWATQSGICSSAACRAGPPTMHKLVRDLYKRILSVGRDYPGNPFVSADFSID